VAKWIGKETEAMEGERGAAGSQDGRFEEVGFSAKFARRPRSKNKLMVDDRFAHMFTDDDFAQMLPKVDNKGRRLRKSQRKRGDDLRKFYKLEDDQHRNGEGESERKRKTAKMSRAEYLEKLSRGEIGGVESDSSGDMSISGSSSSEEHEGEQVESDVEKEVKPARVEDKEEKEDIPMGEATARIAVQNLDWARLRAQDIFAALLSFIPPGGKLLKVRVFQSLLGEEQMEKEERYGPQIKGVKAKAVPIDEPTDFENPGEGAEFDLEKVRKYEMRKLKFYFAVAHFDSVETADKVYNECDGMEFEKSSSCFDLRFVPDDVAIDRPLRDEAEGISEDYEAPLFVTKALQSSKVEITWDEDNYEREKLRTWSQIPQKGRRIIGERELEAFIASSSDEDEEGDADEDLRKKAALHRANLRKALLEEPEESTKEDEELEGKKSEGGSALEEQFDLTKEQGQDANYEQEDADHFTFNDPFFESSKKKRKQDSSKGKKKYRWEDSESEGDDREDSEESRRNREEAELELLLLDEKNRKQGSGLEGFNFKAILQGEKILKKKKAKLKGRRGEKKRQLVEAVEIDDFKVDTKDERFRQFYEDPEFSVDRTNPQYKETRNMRVLEEEQLRHRSERHNGEENPSKNSPFADDLFQLANKVRVKTQQLDQKKAKRSSKSM